MIESGDEYQLFLRGVKGLAEGTSNSYITYLNAITKRLYIDITSKTVSDDYSVKNILDKLENTGIDKGYWSNCQAALHAYFNFINSRVCYKAVYPDEVNHFTEGTAVRVTVNKYERDTKARDACIAHYKPVCAVCGFDFYLTYGDLGKGFIHVHHVIPLSEIGSQYEIDPIKDLLPVCPNCHAMLHVSKPPLSVSKLKDILNRRRA